MTNIPPPDTYKDIISKSLVKPHNMDRCGLCDERWFAILHQLYLCPKHLEIVLMERHYALRRYDL